MNPGDRVIVLSGRHKGKTGVILCKHTDTYSLYDVAWDHCGGVFVAGCSIRFVESLSIEELLTHINSGVRKLAPLNKKI